MEPQPEPQPDEAARKIAEALDGAPEEREAQYASLEGAMRAAPPSSSGRDAVAALALAHVKPLCVPNQPPCDLCAIARGAAIVRRPHSAAQPQPPS